MSASFCKTFKRRELLPPTAMIIQCDNCQTKFSVDSDLVQSADNPRFHCSRCDHYFRLTEDSPSPEVETEKPVSSPSIAKQMSLLDKNQIEIPSEPSPLEKQIAVSWIEEPEPELSQEIPDPAPRLQKPKVRTRTALPEPLNSRKTWSKLATICSVPLLTLGCIAILSQNLAQVPKLLKNYLALVPGNLSTVPPDGVEILSLNAKNNFLDSGTGFLEFSGEVLNVSSKILKDATVEVKLFNSQGALIHKEKASTSSSISEADSVSSLTEEVIQEMQKQASSEKTLIKSEGGRKRFRLVVLEPPEETSWYSARVYSVKSEKP